MARNTGRSTCRTCHASVLTVYVNGSLTVLDWPHALNGDHAVYQTVAGGFQARYCPVGEDVSPIEKRYRVHACQPPAPDLSEPQRAAEPVTGPVPADQVKRWQQAVAAHEARLRNQRVRRPGKAAAAIEKPGMYVKRPEGKP